MSTELQPTTSSGTCWESGPEKLIYSDTQTPALFFSFERLCVGVQANCIAQHVLNCSRARPLPSSAPPASSLSSCLPLHCQVWLLFINAESEAIMSQGMVTDPRIRVVRLYFPLCFFAICQVLQIKPSKSSFLLNVVKEQNSAMNWDILGQFWLRPSMKIHFLPQIHWCLSLKSEVWEPECRKDSWKRT